MVGLSDLVKIVLQDLGDALVRAHPSRRLDRIDGVPPYRLTTLLFHVAVVDVVEDLLEGDAHHPRSAERYVDDVGQTICGLDHIPCDGSRGELLHLFHHEPSTLDDPLGPVERRDLWMIQAQDFGVKVPDLLEHAFHDASDVEGVVDRSHELVVQKTEVRRHEVEDLVRHHAIGRRFLKGAILLDV